MRWSLRVSAAAGLMVGLTLLMLALQSWIDNNAWAKVSQALVRNDYLVISKPVSMLGSAMGKPATFAQRELDEMRQQEFVEAVVPFTAGTFPVMAEVSPGNDLPALSTLLFFEAVPNEYLDIDLTNWHWTPDSEEVPVVLPRLYLQLYNHGFAESQGLPKLSENMISQVSFVVKIGRRNHGAAFRARIVAFSDQLNSIIVPKTFMDWANSNYGTTEQKDPSRLIVLPTNTAGAAVAEYIEAKHYETPETALKNSKQTRLLRTVLGIVGVFAGLVALLALLLFSVSLQLLLLRNQGNIVQLLRIGYPAARIVRYFAIGMLVMLLLLLTGAIGSVALVRSFAAQSLASIQLDLSGGLAPQTWALGLGICVLLGCWQWLRITRTVRKLARA